MNGLSEIKARLATATPGPWEARHGDVVHVRGGIEHQIAARTYVNSEFIANAPEDQARLIAALESVESGLSGLDEIFNGDSEGDTAIRAISDGLRVAMAEALAGREVGS